MRKIKVQVKWAVTCRCGRRYTLRKGQIVRCSCGMIIRA